MSNHSPSRPRTRLGAAGLLGAAVALVAVTGAGPAPSIFQLTGAAEDVRGGCDEPEHAGDPSCAGTLTVLGTEDDTTSTTEAPSPTSVPDDEAADDVRTVTTDAVETEHDSSDPGSDDAVGTENDSEGDLEDDADDSADIDDDSSGLSGDDDSADIDDDSSDLSGDDDSADIDDDSSDPGSDDLADDSGDDADDGPGHD